MFDPKKSKSKTILHADETVVFDKGSTEIVGIKHDATLAAVANWFRKIKLTKNTAKTQHSCLEKVAI